MGPIVRTLQPYLAQICANEIRQLTTALVNRFLHGFWNAGVKEKQVYFFLAFIPFPDSHHTAIKNDRGQRIIDQFAFPPREGLIGVLCRNESVHNLALSLKESISIRDEANRGFGQLECEKTIQIRLAEQELVFRPLHGNRNQLRLYLGSPAN